MERLAEKLQTDGQNTKTNAFCRKPAPPPPPPNGIRCFNTYGSYACPCLSGFRPINESSDPKLSGCVEICNPKMCGHGKCEIKGDKYRCPLLTPPAGNRNPRKVDWDSYREELGLLLGGNVFNFPSLADIDMTVDNVQSAIVQSFNSNSRVASSGLPRRVPWWSKDLGDLRKECRKLFNKAKKTGDWAINQKELALATFLDIEGAFDRVPTEAI
ncbi:hypothetical protein JTE90_015477, partial [Oedothorax gibbosus]